MARFRCRGDGRNGVQRGPISVGGALVRVCRHGARRRGSSFSRRSRCANAFAAPGKHRLVAGLYLAPDTPLRKSEGDMPASLRNDLLKALSEPKPESMATRSTLASWCINSACA